MCIVVSDAVHCLTEGGASDLAFSEAQEARIRGLDEPVTLYHLRRPRAA